MLFLFPCTWNSVRSGNANEYNFWIFTHFFFFGTFLQCLMSWRQSSIKRNVCMGIPQHLFCLSAWRSYHNQWLQSIHQKAIPILLILAYVIFSFLIIWFIAYSPTKELLSVTLFCEENFKIEDDANSLVL